MPRILTTKLSRKLISLILALLIGSIFRTLRLSITPDSSRQHLDGEIFAFWHGKMMVGWLLAQRLYDNDKIHCVVSPSNDGEILSQALKRHGISLLRGSSSKNRELLRKNIKSKLLENHVIVVTPDGPRGPLRQMKYGLLKIASELALPMVFARIQFAKSIRLRSWDEFEIPFPFSRVEIHLTQISVPKFSSQEELKHYEKQLSQNLSAPH